MGDARRRAFRSAVTFASLSIVALACGGESLPAADPSSTSSDAPATGDARDDTGAGATDDPAGDEPHVEPDAEPSTEPSDDEQPTDAIAVPVRIADAESAVPFDRRLLGTNLPAWLGPQRLRDPGFQQLAAESGATVMRMPGGSWSNAYDWAGCELDDEERCFWPWAARPTDFAAFLDATELDGMWTVSINHTAQSAAAAVAFFNGSVDDGRRLGVDRDGVDWGTVGEWARLRRDNGHPEPVGIALWEVGNEVYAGKPESGGDQCASFGWETVWTCDGATYVRGDADHDGYLAIREAMRAVDPTISVGAVGVPDPGGWSNWGGEVVDEAGDALDFYVVHQYGFDSSPSITDALERPAERWPQVVDAVREVLDADVPIAVTEYNLVAVETRDDDQTMTRAVNALYLADSIGQLARGGVTVANQWNFANGQAANGTDYGLVHADDQTTYPQYDAMAIWGRARSTLLDATVDDETVRVYPTVDDDGDATVVVVNLGADTIALELDVAGSPLERATPVSLTTAFADDPSAQVMSTEAVELAASDSGTLGVELRPWSISAIELTS